MSKEPDERNEEPRQSHVLDCTEAYHKTVFGEDKLLCMHNKLGSVELVILKRFKKHDNLKKEVLEQIQSFRSRAQERISESALMEEN